MTLSVRIGVAALTVFCWTGLTLGQGGPGLERGQGRAEGRGFGRGFGRGAGGPGMHGHDERHENDHQTFQFLLTHHKQIDRKVTELSNGVVTLTESDDPEIADKIKEHVQWMEHRIKEAKPIRMRDPLFREIFRHADKIEMKHEDTEKGVRVTETSSDPYVAKLIKSHAKTVSGFVERGFAEAMKNHPVPDKPNVAQAKFYHPLIEGYGQVVRLPAAVQQPRSGTKLLVDVTSGSDPGKLNAGIEKAARYVNIYHGAGEREAEFEMSVVLHGGATLAALNDDAYKERFGVTHNPNLDCLRRLHESGVGLYVCGQSLIGKGAKEEDVAVFVDTAVSALTAVVNLQADGFAYVPLGD